MAVRPRALRRGSGEVGSARGEVQFLRDGYEALAGGDMETFTALARERLAPDLEFHPDARETYDDYSHACARQPR